MQHVIRLILVLGLLVSVTLNLVQRSAIARLETALVTTGPVALSLTAGLTVPPMVARNLEGQELGVNFEKTEYTVLYVFSPSCIWCARNLTSISRLASSAEPRFRFLGVSEASVSEIAEYVKSHVMPFPVVAEISEGSAQAYRIGPTPQTIVIRRGGEVAKVWSGAYVENTKSQVERFFSVSLPDPDWRDAY